MNMSLVINVMWLVLLAAGILALISIGYHFFLKSKLSTGVQIQCSTGDSEVMSFTYNFDKGESEESKQAKISEGFAKIDARRLENHQKWLKIKEESEKENLAKAEKLKVVEKENA